MKAAQKEADEWQDKYWNYRLESKEKEIAAKEEMLLLKLEIAQLKEVVARRTERLRMYEKADEDGGPQVSP